jgi:type VI secretion system secreted protein VgrG
VHAGKGFGGIDIPRIGEEVIVDFLEGDPDRPIITGRVYHAENMPPFGLPGDKVVSGMKSNSTPGGGGYNEFVMNDTKGNELIRLHGQFDMDSTIENDLREHVLNNRSRDVTNNETISIGVDRTETVGSNESLTVGANKTIQIGADHSETIGSNMTINVGSCLTETVAINYAETVGAAMELTIGGLMALTVGAVMTQTVGGAYLLTVGAVSKETVAAGKSVSIGGALSETIGAAHSETVAAAYMLKAASIAMTADTKITLTTGSASIVMESGGKISIEGTDITINGSGKINATADGEMTLKGSKIHAN